MKAEIITAKSIKDYKSFLPEEEYNSLFSLQTIGIGVRDDDKRAVGILIYEVSSALEGEEKENLYCDYFFVEPESRGKKAFSTMFSHLCKKGLGRKMGGIVFGVIYPQMSEIVPLLEHYGAERLSDGNRVFQFDVDMLSDSVLSAMNTSKYDPYIMSLYQAPKEQIEMFNNGFGTRFPDGLGPDDVPGALLKDYSFLFVVKGEIKGFLLASVVNGSQLYLASIYVDGAIKQGVLVLLHHLLKRVQQKRFFKRVMLTTVNEASFKLTEHILKDYMDQVEQQVVRNYYIGL